jgi:tRNA A37 threonylcarbamoyladenosine dehydratase
VFRHIKAVFALKSIDKPKIPRYNLIMIERQERTIKVIGSVAAEKLRSSRVAVFGAGGVGGAAIEALARIGVGALDVIDGDCFTESNLNRQILATVDTIGQRKVVVAADRIGAINPDCVVQAWDIFVTPDNIVGIDFSVYDYVIDAIDNVTAKIAIALNCRDVGTKLVMCMGTGNKLDSTRFKITDIYKTSVCPLAKVMRRELKNRGIESMDALWSDEIPTRFSEIEKTTATDGQARAGSAPVPGSVSFVPPVAGMMLAGFVVKSLIL